MKFLLFDSCTPQHQVALVDSGKIVESLSQKRGSLPSMAEQLLTNTAWHLSELAFIAVTVGPGSYTGIRVGCASAQGLALASGLPVVELCSLHGLRPSETGDFVALLDARQDRVYSQVGHFNGLSSQWKDEAQLCLRSSLPTGVPQVEGSPSMDVLAQEAEKAFQSNRSSTDGSLNLLYLRKTQAEIERESRLA